MNSRPQTVTREQRAGRRGLMMGMTLAEVLLLVLFALLLLIVNEQSAWKDLRPVRSQLLAHKDDLDSAVRFVEVAKRLENLDASPERLVRALDEVKVVQESNFDDYFDELVRASKTKPALHQRIQELEEKGAEHEKIIESMQRLLGESGKPEEIIADLARENAALGNRNSELNSAVKDLMRRTGAGFPSCWYGKDGKQEFLWSVAMYDEGFVVLDRPVKGRVDDKSAMGLNKLPYGARISMEEFRNWGSRAFSWSRKQTPECRFFVAVYDFTGSNKVIYKTLLHRHIEGYFYKLLVPDADEKTFPLSGTSKFFQG